MLDTDVTSAMQLVIAAGADDHELFSSRLDGEPIAKSRARVGRGGRIYTPGRTADAERDIAARLQASRVPEFRGNIAVAAIFYRSNRHRIDLDNLLKTLLDGITKSGRVWADDDQVTALIGRLEYDRDVPRTVFAIGHHRSTMLRGVDRFTHVCETCGKPYKPHGGSEGRSRYCSRVCRPRRVQLCVDCGGPTSAPHVKRCVQCFNVHRRGVG